jgi:monoamine oxidase
MPGTFEPLTRRSFLELVGQAGGSVALYSAMRALDLQAAEPDAPFAPAGRAPHGTRVLILGAGITGLTAAYELQKLGYDTEILEARTRVGGRCITARRGFVSEEDGPTAGQTCAFDEGLYLNVGPMRIPHTHATTLDYCRELDVAVEMFTSVNEAAYIHQSNPSEPRCGKLRLREVKADWRGYTSELLAKALSPESLDRPLSKEDGQRIVDWLRYDGGLNDKLQYVPSGRRGYRIAPGAGELEGIPTDAVTLAQLIHTNFAGSLTTDLMLQSPMFQVVGGTDRLASALAAHVRNVKLGADVVAIEQPEGRVRVRYRDASGLHETGATYCICTLPLVLLKDVTLDVTPALREAIRNVGYASAGKVGIQFKRRFWEEDEGIFSGITKTDLEISQIVYPSYGFLGRKGILIGYYHVGGNAATMGDLPPAERQARAIDQGSQIHPQYRKEFDNAFSIAWQKVRYSKGSWAQISEEMRKSGTYRTLLHPDRAFYLAGDYLTYANAWMQGAFQSARAVVSSLHARASREAASTSASFRLR